MTRAARPRSKFRAGALAHSNYGRFLNCVELLPAAAASATTTTTTATTASAAVTAAAAAGTRPLLARLVHLDTAALDFSAVELRNCARSFIGISHLHEAKAARLAGKFVGNNSDVVHLAHLSEQRFQILIGYRKGQVAYI